MEHKRVNVCRLAAAVGLLAITPALSGCWLVAAGAGAEAGYVAAQDKTVGETIDDQRIVSVVKSKLLADSDVSGLAINVDSDGGVVTLKGFVNSLSEREKALRIARSVSGVTDVRSKLVVDTE